MKSSASLARSSRAFISMACGVLLAVALGGCAIDSEDLSELNDAPSMTDPAESQQDGGAGALDPGDKDKAEGDLGERVEPAHDAGTIALSWSGGTPQRFEYQAEHCYVGADYVLVEGKGGPIDGSGESIVKIFTTPEELLHEGTGTYQADGLVQFSWDGDEIIADGRQIHVGDYPQPATFTYRQDGSTVKYVVNWFRGGEDSGAGAVTVDCNF